MPEIEQLLYGFSPNRKVEREKRWLFTNDGLIKKINNIKAKQDSFV